MVLAMNEAMKKCFAFILAALFLPVSSAGVADAANSKKSGGKKVVKTRPVRPPGKTRRGDGQPIVPKPAPATDPAPKPKN
jgi:hypothetical protein